MKKIIGLLIVVMFFQHVSGLYLATAAETVAPEATSASLRLDLQQCLEQALKNSQQRLVSKAAVAIAEAQHQQALSSYWPQISGRFTATRMDKEPNFIFPAANMNFSIPDLLPPTAIPIPEQDVKLMDRDSYLSSLALVYPLYLGGKRAALANQAELGVQAAKVAARRSDLELTTNVKRYYWGALLAARLRGLGQETLERFLATQELTKHLYENGGGTVKKTDFLRLQVIVAAIKSSLELMQSNEQLAKAALVNYMGLKWQSQLELAENDIPFTPWQGDLAEMVKQAYVDNTDWQSMEIGLQVGSAKIKEAGSGHLPIVAFTANVLHIDNDYDKGLMSSDNKDSWNMAINLELPLFGGFLTTGKLQEAKNRLQKLEHQKLLLQEGIALQVKNAFLQIERAARQVETLAESIDTANENRELNNRAYQQELVETSDVIEAQLLQSFIEAQHLKALYDHILGQVELAFIIGTELEQTL